MDKKFDDLFKYIDNITETNKVKKKKNTIFKILSFFISIISIGLLVSSGYFIKIAVDNKNDYNESKSTSRELKNNALFDLMKKNPDTVGYLKVPNTIIDYPVVKTDNNKFYLKNDFYKNRKD